MVLVSAIYNNGVDTVIGGRGRDISFYYSTLRNLGNLEVPYVLYCDPLNVEKYTEILANIFKKFYVFGVKLEDFIFYQEFITWKETFWKNIYLNDRNEILCYKKFYFLKDIISKKIFSETERYFWIDSGLTHHGIIPEKVGGVELLTNPGADIYYPFNKNNIFTPTLGKKLEEHIPHNKFLFCGHPLNYSIDERLIEIASSVLNAPLAPPTYHIIGGIFGGSVELIEKHFIKYEQILKEVINNKIHVLEEPILTVLYPHIQEDIILETFSNWWFYSPGERNSFLTEEADSFYKIFTRIYEQ